MKKYFIASVVAVMAFAFAAFAASFTVGDSVLASGTGNVTSCGDAEITYSTQTIGSGDFGINALTIEFEEDCTGSHVLLATYSHNLPPAGGSSQTGFKVSDAIAGDSITIATNPSKFEVADLEGLAVLVKDNLVPGEAGWASGVLAP
jgi:hypothetical protein